MKNEMYVSLDEPFLEKERKKAKQEAIASECKDALLWESLPTEVIAEEISESGVFLSLKNDLGYYSIDWTPSTDDLVSLIEVAVKKLNKMKTVLEAVK